MKRETIELLGLGVGAVAIGLFIARARSEGAQPDTSSGFSLPSGPNYLDYNQPDLGSSPAANLASLGTVQNPSPSGASSPSCSCGSNGSISFSGLSGLANSLENSTEGFLSQYEGNVLSQFPDFVSQFFNNQTALAESTQAETQFASMQGA